MASSRIEQPSDATRLALRALATGLGLAIRRGRAAIAAGDTESRDAALDEGEELLRAIGELLPATPPVRL